ncbi:MAG: hypothetical protein R3A46_12900 [Thermomicrobiales bacterium]
MLVFAACGGDDDDDDTGSIEDADSCEEVGDVFIDEIQVLLDELSDMSLADLQSEDQPEAMTNFETNVEEIGAKSDELGCSDEEISQILQDRVDELEADGPVPELLLEGIQQEIQSGNLFESN